MNRPKLYSEMVEALKLLTSEAAEYKLNSKVEKDDLFVRKLKAFADNVAQKVSWKEEITEIYRGR